MVIYMSGDLGAAGGVTGIRWMGSDGRTLGKGISFAFLDTNAKLDFSTQSYL